MHVLLLEGKSLIRVTQLHYVTFIKIKILTLGFSITLFIKENVVNKNQEQVSKIIYIFILFFIKTFRNYTRTMVSFIITNHQSNIGPTN